MKIAVCDDDAVERVIIEQLTQKFLTENFIEAEIVCYKSGETLLNEYKPGIYGLLLLDIFMEKINGIDVAKTIRQVDEVCEIIFITTSTDYALDGYRVRAMNYLVKPISWDDMQQNLSRCTHLLFEAQRYIILKCEHNFEKILLSSILFAEVFDHHTIIHTTYGNKNTRCPLDELEELLKGSPFHRIGRSTLVNFKEVIDMQKDGFILSNKCFIPMRTRDSKIIREMYTNYQFEMVTKGCTSKPPHLHL